MRFELQLIPPVDAGDQSSRLKTAIEIIKQAGFPVAVTSVGAAVTGGWEDVMPVLKEIHETLGSRIPGLTTTVRIENGESENKSSISDDTLVEEASEESFPASDPPSFTLGE